MRLSRLVLKNLLRRPGRSALSVLGVASAMLMLLLVESLATGFDAAMSGANAEKKLIVYRENRWCPQTSHLPESYAPRIRNIPGVESVLPVKVYLNNCRATLDLVTFQGAPATDLLASRNLELLAGDLADFEGERDAALLGKGFADRRGLEVGDSFRMGDIVVKVSGIFTSDEPTEQNLILTHLEFLQRAPGVQRLGTVTQFEVEVADASAARSVAEAIDLQFATAEEPTDTRPLTLHLESATRDLREVLRFGRLLGLGCVAVILSLVGNAIALSVQERVREFGVFRTLGYTSGFLARLVLAEALALAALGCTLGVGGALLILELTHLSIGAEGISIDFVAGPGLVARGFTLAFACGALAGSLPAWRSARRTIVEALGS